MQSSGKRIEISVAEQKLKLLNGDGVVADIGAGTGIFSRQLAKSGWRVIAIEPSPAMLRQHTRLADGLHVVRVTATASFPSTISLSCRPTSRCTVT